MFGISKLTSAISKLAGALTAFATTVAEVNDALRAQAGLDAPARKGRKALASHTEEGNGKAVKGKEGVAT